MPINISFLLKPHIRYLCMIIHTRLAFKQQQVYDVNNKASWLMPNVGGIRNYIDSELFKALAQLSKMEWQRSICWWQRKGDTAVKGRWTYRLIPDIEHWLNRNSGEIHFYLLKMITGHSASKHTSIILNIARAVLIFRKMQCTSFLLVLASLYYEKCLECIS